MPGIVLGAVDIAVTKMLKQNKTNSIFFFF